MYISYSCRAQFSTVKKQYGEGNEKKRGFSPTLQTNLRSNCVDHVKNIV